MFLKAQEKAQEEKKREQAIAQKTGRTQRKGTARAKA
jgi:hypothetical protein